MCRRVGLLAFVVGLSLLITSCASTPASLGSPVPTISPTSPPSTWTAVPTSTLVPGPTSKATPSVEPTLTASATPTGSSAETHIPTATPTQTATRTPTRTPTSSPTATRPPPTPTRTPTQVAPSPTPVPTAKARGDRVFLGYYVPYDPSSWASLQAQADLVDFVAPQWVSVDACGNVGSQDDLTLVRFARSRGIGVLPSLFTISGWLNHILLTDEPTTARLVQQLVDYVVQEGYEGLDIDLEGVNAGDRQALTAFVARISKELRKQGKLVTMAVPAKTYDATTGWAGAYDYAALAPHVDYFVIMAYSYTTSASPPGSTAPYGWVDKVAAFACSRIPPSKVLLGVAFYGYDWNLTMGGRARALRYPEAEAIVAAYGANVVLDPTTRSATFAYTARLNDPPIQWPRVPPLNHEIKTRSRPPCPIYPTPAPTPTPTVVPTPAPVQEHVVWLENTASVAARLDIARRYGAGGVAAWRLGQEDPGVWSLLSAYRGSPR